MSGLICLHFVEQPRWPMSAEQIREALVPIMVNAPADIAVTREVAAAAINTALAELVADGTLKRVLTGAGPVYRLVAADAWLRPPPPRRLP